MRRKQRAAAAGPGLLVRWERSLLSLFGPPQLGDPNEPRREVPQDWTCSLCGRLDSEHSYDRSKKITLVSCPGVTRPGPGPRG